ncbi:hypothetical protein [Streptomyces sp. NPDC057557]|uniref:hypothetical protein n=1 Tax=Streptomyces sp. NPDC057557 TaxID=3346167 RepID=UPI003681A026
MSSNSARAKYDSRVGSSSRPANPTAFHVAPDLIACVSDLGDGTFEVTDGARHRSALRPFEELGIDWLSFDG